MNNIIRSLLQAVLSTHIFNQLRKPKKAKDGKVHLPKFFAILGAITSSIFLVPTIITAFSDEDVWVPVLFLVFSLLGATLIIAFVNCRISYDEDGFVAKTFFGIKRKASYDQVTAIKENMHETYIYVGKRRVMVDEYSIGGEIFINLVKKKYRTFNNGKSIPKIQKNKHDIFNGHVEDVTGFYVGYGLVLVILLGLLVFMIYEICIPKNIDNTIEHTVNFVSCEAAEDDVILTSADNQIYKIQFSAEQIDFKSIKAVCDGKVSVKTYSKEVSPDDGDDFYSVEAIKHNGNYLLSFEESCELYRQQSGSLFAFWLFMLLLWVAYIVASVIVGRNPQKYGKKVVRLFFKDGYVKY